MDLLNLIGGASVGQVLNVSPKKRKEVLPSNNDCGSPVLTGIHRLTSTRQQRSTSTVDSSNVERTLWDNRKASAPVKSNLLDQQLLASLSATGIPDATRLKLLCYLPCKNIGEPEHSGWVHRARCAFENDTTKKWKKRWLVLKREYLLIYKSSEVRFLLFGIWYFPSSEMVMENFARFACDAGRG